MQFKAFKPSGMEKIARSMGYQGSMDGFNQFVAQDPMRQQQMQQYQQQAMQMARGGVVRMQTGGTTTATTDTKDTTKDAGTNIADFTVGQVTAPGLPEGGKVEAASTPLTEEQQLSADTGKLTGTVGVGTALAGRQEAVSPEQFDPQTVSAQKSADDVNAAVDSVQAAQTNPDDPRSQVVASQQTVSSVGNLEAIYCCIYIISRFLC